MPHPGLSHCCLSAGLLAPRTPQFILPQLPAIFLTRGQIMSLLCSKPSVLSIRLGWQSLYGLGHDPHLLLFTLFLPTPLLGALSFFMHTSKLVVPDFCFCCPSSRNCPQIVSWFMPSPLSRPDSSIISDHSILLLSILSHLVCCTKLLIYYNLPSAIKMQALREHKFLSIPFIAISLAPNSARHIVGTQMSIWIWTWESIIQSLSIVSFSTLA